MREHRRLGNVTWIGADGPLLAFDIGPGNGSIDDWCARRAGLRFDRDGALAASGKVDRARAPALQRRSPSAGELPKSPIAATSAIHGPTASASPTARPR